MSGVEGAAAGDPSFVWELSIGSLLTLLTTVSLVGGGFMAFLKHLKANRETSEKALSEIVNMKKQIEGHEEDTAENLKHNLDRINELKVMMTMIDRRIDEVKKDANKKDDEQKQELAELARMLERFRDELHDLVVDVERRLKGAAASDRAMYSGYREEDKQTRQRERTADRDSRYRDEQRRQDYEADAGGGRMRDSNGGLVEEEDK